MNGIITPVEPHKNTEAMLVTSPRHYHTRKDWFPVHPHSISQDNSKQEIKLCECGCGLPAPIAKYSFAGKGWVKGQPKRFIKGHNAFKQQDYPEPNPSGLCLCGCGQPAPLARDNNATLGYIQGRPVRFIYGHSNKNRPIRPIEERFWENVTRGSDDECWLWQGGRSPDGYGQLKVLGKTLRAHRVSWEIHYGEIPAGMGVLHRCDTPPCQNPFHFFLGTNADNVHDMDAKGRGRRSGTPGKRGETNLQAKLRSSDIPEIRRLSAQGVYQRDIARRFGVSQRTIQKVLKGETWAHVP